MTWNYGALATYVQDVKNLWDTDAAEVNLAISFSSFIQAAFQVEANEFTYEKTIRMVDINRRGRTDILFGDLVFEFKKRSTFDRADRNQLRDYLVEMNRKGDDYTGLFTNGLQFEAYVLSENELKLIDSFNLDELSPESAFVRLDAYVFSQKSQKPTAEDVVARFGGHSPSFIAFEQALSALLAEVSDSPTIETWRLQWRRLLSRVYGSDIGDNDLFVRHTYLCQFAKLLGYTSQRGIPNTVNDIEAIITGSAFNALGIKNIGENDFYSWVLMPTIKDRALKLFKRLADGLIVYDLTAIDQDLLKQLYQNLVDPQTRHDLGEFYTPDWLAELTLEEINYQPKQSIYDPTCGSGSFLFAALRRLAKLGLVGADLVNFAENNVVGTDVHPLAVTIARMNYLLALAEHLRAATGLTKLISIPVFMADALIKPLENEGVNALELRVTDSKKSDEVFKIPYESIQNEQVLTEIVDKMERFAENKMPNLDAFQRTVHEAQNGTARADTLAAWRNNLNLLAKLKAEDRNGIWAYILKNLARPLALAQRKFDVIIGNPPWLTYKDIKRKDYQKEVKSLQQYYQLIATGDTKLFTQMELSSLFFALVHDRYLKKGGTLAFVMPRSVITGAKQHRPFQQQGFSRILDLNAVEPLFRTATCVLILQDSRLTEALPSKIYSAKFPSHELDLETARPYLTVANGKKSFVDNDVRSPYYYDNFKQGATLVPRNLCFVKPEGLPSSPSVMTDPEANKDAKKPYKGVLLKGNVADNYIYTTLLSKHFMPFGYEKLHMVALPLRQTEEGLQMLENRADFEETGDFDSWDWFEKATKKWDELKKADSDMSFTERLDYQRTLTKQNPSASYKVIYNSSGTNISAFVIETAILNLRVHGRKTQGFIVDYGAFFYDTSSQDEAHYLVSILNAPVVSIAIKDYQTRGIYKGERHVQRTPFEACAIPPFDASNEKHCQLAALSQAAHAELAYVHESPPQKGGVVALRNLARRQTAKQLTAIDELTREVLGL